MADTAKPASADVQAEYDALRRDIARLSEAVARLVGEKAGEAGTHAREGVDQTASAVRDAASSACGRVTDFVEDKPTTSLLIAFGIGMLFGTFARRS